MKFCDKKQTEVNKLSGGQYSANDSNAYIVMNEQISVTSTNNANKTK